MEVNISGMYMPGAESNYTNMPGAESNYANGVRGNQQQNMQVQWYYFTMVLFHNGTIS